MLAAIAEANTGTVPAYGDDAVTAEAVRLLRGHFGAEAQAYVVFNGTGANVVGLQSMVRSFESVNCADSAHINVDECGAPEKLLGAKLVDVPAPGGKLTLDAVDAARWGVGDPHHVQAKVVSVTQSTECGTVYSLQEIRALADYAHERGMYLHLDGARIANAAVSLGVELGELGSAAGVDVLSSVPRRTAPWVPRPSSCCARSSTASMEFLRKQSMQLASKMRFMSAQIVAPNESTSTPAARAQLAELDAERHRGVRDPGAVEVQVHAALVRVVGEGADLLQRVHGTALRRLGDRDHLGLHVMRVADPPPRCVDGVEGELPARSRHVDELRRRAASPGPRTRRR